MKIIRLNMFFLVLLVLLLLIPVSAQKETVFNAQEPALITSAGQSADVLMIKILSDKAGVSYLFDKIATEENAEDPEKLMEYLQQVGHPVLEMEPLF